MADLNELLSRLDKVRQSKQNRWISCCPAHDDKTPSLQISMVESDRILIHCFSGCGAAEVLDAINLDYSVSIYHCVWCKVSKTVPYFVTNQVRYFGVITHTLVQPLSS